MEVVRLGPGESAPVDVDCIRVEAEGGKFRLIASALEGCRDDEEAESVAMIRGQPYATREDAEAAGMAWAADHCVQQLYIETPEAPDVPT
jgi:hypothetical protein